MESSGQTCYKANLMKKQAMKRSQIFLIGLISLAVSSGSYALLKLTPDQVIHQNVSCPTAGATDARDVQVLGTHRWAKGVIVLYSALCAQDTQGKLQRVFGHQVVKQNGMNWQVSSSDSYRISNPKRPSERLIEYGISQAKETGGDRYTILYGQFLATKVAAVEVTFDNGEVLRDDGTSKAFALISSGAASVCELRVLGSENQVLRRENLSRPNPLELPKRLISDRKQLGSRCLPVSNRL